MTSEQGQDPPGTQIELGRWFVELYATKPSLSNRARIIAAVSLGACRPERAVHRLLLRGTSLYLRRRLAYATPLIRNAI